MYDELKLHEIIQINLFMIYDLLDALGVRKYLNREPSAFEKYSQSEDAETFIERIRAIYKGKEEKTRRLIRIKRENNGVIPERYRRLCKKTLCGILRLHVAERHNIR